MALLAKNSGIVKTWSIPMNLSRVLTIAANRPGPQPLLPIVGLDDSAPSVGKRFGDRLPDEQVIIDHEHPERGGFFRRPGNSTRTQSPRTAIVENESRDDSPRPQELCQADARLHLGLCGKVDRDRRTASRRARNADVPAMRFNQALGRRQSKT
jgi:hypothetical protein